MTTENLVLMLQQREVPLGVIAQRARVRKTSAQKIIERFGEEGLSDHLSRGHFTMFQLPLGVPRFDIECARHNKISLDGVANHIYRLMERNDSAIWADTYNDAPHITRGNPRKDLRGEDMTPDRYRLWLARTLKYMEKLGVATIDWRRVKKSFPKTRYISTQLPRDTSDLGYPYDPEVREEYPFKLRILQEDDRMYLSAPGHKMDQVLKEGVNPELFEYDIVAHSLLKHALDDASRGKEFTSVVRVDPSKLPKNVSGEPTEDDGGYFDDPIPPTSIDQVILVASFKDDKGETLRSAQRFRDEFKLPVFCINYLQYQSRNTLGYSGLFNFVR